jgi:GTPase
MKFYDKVSITLYSGKGGDGVVSARREAGVPYGGPAGGNGWRGGSVIIRGSVHVNTLVDFHYKKKLVADNGMPGRTKEKYGKQADDLIINLPLGSILRDLETGEPLWQCLDMTSEYMVVRGGQGGIGNMHFKNSVNQYPQFALLGEPGELRPIEIELQLLADVALIGTPSVGKSSLINAIANVKAKVADYPFTTLVPNLGSVKYKDTTFNVIDIPGLIEGASQGKGLGNEFLRHIMKARVLCFMVDMSRYESGMSEISILINELVQYLTSTILESKDYGVLDSIDIQLNTETPKRKLDIYGIQGNMKKQLFSKDIMLVANKIDEVEDDEIRQEYLKGLKADLAAYIKKTWNLTIDPVQTRIMMLSALGQEWVDAWLDVVVEEYIIPGFAALEHAGELTISDTSPMILQELDPVGDGLVQEREDDFSGFDEHAIDVLEDDEDEFDDEEEWDEGEIVEYIDDGEENLDDESGDEEFDHDDAEAWGDDDSNYLEGEAYVRPKITTPPAPEKVIVIDPEEVLPEGEIIPDEHRAFHEKKKNLAQRRKESIVIYECTATDMPMLIEQEFVEAQDVKYSKVWYLAERETCRLTFMIPWGNDEAEMWFWNVMDKKRLLQKLITAGLVKGDIIHVKSFYHGVEDRFIRY